MKGKNRKVRNRYGEEGERKVREKRRKREVWR